MTDDIPALCERVRQLASEYADRALEAGDRAVDFMASGASETSGDYNELSAKYGQANADLLAAASALEQMAKELEEAKAQAAHDRDVLESYRGTYTREKERREQAESALAQTREALEQNVDLPAVPADLEPSKRTAWSRGFYAGVAEKEHQVNTALKGQSR